jgi:hypothetical protein
MSCRHVLTPADGSARGVVFRSNVPDAVRSWPAVLGC